MILLLFILALAAYPVLILLLIAACFLYFCGDQVATFLCIAFPVLFLLLLLATNKKELGGGRHEQKSGSV